MTENATRSIPTGGGAPTAMKTRGVLRNALPPLFVAVSLLALWQLIVTVFHVPAYLVPGPIAIAEGIVAKWDSLSANVLVTAGEMLVGFLLAVVAGVIIAVILHISPAIRRTVFPLLVASQTIPVVVFAPLLVVLLGFGIGPKLVIIALICFFPIVVGFADGLSASDGAYRDLMKSLHGSPWKTLTRVEIPSALPSAFSGARIAATYAAIGAVFAEWSGASAGLGYQIQQSAASLNTTTLFAAVVLLCVLAFALVSVLSLVERFVIPWAPRFTNSR